MELTIFCTFSAISSNDWVLGGKIQTPAESLNLDDNYLFHSLCMLHSH